MAETKAFNMVVLLYIADSVSGTRLSEAVKQIRDGTTQSAPVEFPSDSDWFAALRGEGWRIRSEAAAHFIKEPMSQEDRSSFSSVSFHAR